MSPSASVSAPPPPVSPALVPIIQPPPAPALQSEVAAAAPIVSAPSPAESPPSAQHLAQIADARRRGRLIRRAASVAAFNGWTLTIFAAVTLLASMHSLWGFAGGLVLAAIAHFELRGGKALRRLDRNAAQRLAWNQLALGALVLVYAVANLYIARHGPSISQSAAGNDAQLAKMLEPIDALTRSLTTIVYGVVGAVGAATTMLTSLFYLRRRRMIDSYLEHTPTWIVNLQRMGSTI